MKKFNSVMFTMILSTATYAADMNNMDLVAHEVSTIRQQECGQGISANEVAARDPMYAFHIALASIAPSIYRDSIRYMKETASPETCVDYSLWIERVRENVQRGTINSLSN